MSDNFIVYGISIAVIGTALLLLETSARKKYIKRETARNLLHLAAGTVIASAILFLDDFLLLTATGIIVTAALYLMLRYDIIPQINDRKRRSWGIFYFALSFLLLVLFCGGEYRWIISIAFLITALADPFAAYTGTHYAGSYYRLTSDKKSVIGSAAFFSGVLFSFALPLLTGILDPAARHIITVKIPLYSIFVNDPLYYIAAAGIIALLLTTAEALSSRGLDNLTVPLSAAFLIFYLFSPASEEALFLLVQGSVFGIAIALLSLRIGFLSKDGAAATFLLAALIFGIGSWQWTLPVLVFFLLSSLLSILRKRKNPVIEERFDKSGKRDAFQVMANGGMPALLAALSVIAAGNLPEGTGKEHIYILFVSSIAVVCADTWATEIGTLRKTKTYNIINMKPLEQGRSGGISLPGTAGAFLGAFVIALSAYFWINDISMFLLITLTGFAGSFVDSLLGALVQAQYRCTDCGIVTERKEHCGGRTKLVSGFKMLNNDTVNFGAAFSGSFSAAVIIFIDKYMFI